MNPADADADNSGSITFMTPFDDADADLILRSSDDAYFRVYKVIMKKASPVFGAMFTLPYNHNLATPKSEPQTVTLTEDAEILYQLLHLCYPLAPLPLWTIGEVGTIMRVCEKYQMEEISKNLLVLAVREFLLTEPLRVYAMACQVQANREATLAAAQCLKVPFDSILESDVPELRSLSSAPYRSLLSYHSSCGNAAATTINCYACYEWLWVDRTTCSWFSSTGKNTTCRCRGKDWPILIKGPSQGRTEQAMVHSTWKVYMDGLASSLQRQPALDVRPTALSYAGMPEQMCSGCRERYAVDMSSFVSKLHLEVESAIAKVRFNLEY